MTKRKLGPNGEPAPKGRPAQHNYSTWGRPPEVESDNAKNFIEGVRAGLTYRLAANLAGLSEGGVYYWLKKGKQEKAGKKSKAGPGPYLKFFEAVKKAEADFAAKNLANIQRAADSTDRLWTASAWLAERRFPEDYGDQRREVSELKKLIAQQGKQIDELLGRDASKGKEARSEDTQTDPPR